MPAEEKPFFDTRGLPPAFAHDPLAGLNARTRAQLTVYCANTNQEPADVINDAVALFLDDVTPGEILALENFKDEPWPKPTPEQPPQPTPQPQPPAAPLATLVLVLIAGAIANAAAIAQL